MQYQKQEDFSSEFKQKTQKTDQVSVIELPIAQYSKQQVQSNSEYQLQEFKPYSNASQTQNQIDIIASLLVNPILSKELKLSLQTTYFNCCNCCLGVVIFIYLLSRCFAIFDFEGINMALNVFEIISDCVFVSAVILGLYAINKQQDNLFVQYQVLLSVSCQLDLVAQIIGIIITDLPEKYNEMVVPQTRVKILVFVIIVISFVSFYGMLILWARRLSTLICELRYMRNYLQNQQAQQANNNVLQRQGTI